MSKVPSHIFNEQHCKKILKDGGALAPLPESAPVCSDAEKIKYHFTTHKMSLKIHFKSL